MKNKYNLGLLAILLFISNWAVNAQVEGEDQGPSIKEQAKLKYNLFSGLVKNKNYDEAYDDWMWCFEKSPKLSVNIYKYGIKIAIHKYKNATEENKVEAQALVEKVFNQRMEHYPAKLAKVYSDYATFMHKAGAEEPVVFALLEKGYKLNPVKLSVNNIKMYFTGVKERNKDTNVQLVFDTYDDVVETVSDKIGEYHVRLEKITKREEVSENLSKKEKREKKICTVNLKALGQVEGILDKIILELSTCERLVPMYEKDFEENKMDAVWLKRAVQRVEKKECTDSDLYEKLVKAYVSASPSTRSSVSYANLLLKKGKNQEAMTYFEKAISQEDNLIQKAKYQYTVAQLLTRKSVSNSRKYAKMAIKSNPAMGKAYLLIASLYANSANSCGSSIFEKKMVFTVSLKYAKKAAQVDPGSSRAAKKAINFYSKNIPNKKLKFIEGKKTGEAYTVGCWINETVTIL